MGDPGYPSLSLRLGCLGVIGFMFIQGLVYAAFLFFLVSLGRAF